MFPKLIKYFVHEPEKLKPRPRQFIGDYDPRLASDDEIMLMKAVLARSPEEASRLMKHHKAANVYELIAKLRRKPPTLLQRIASRFVSLVMRIEGASWQHPIDKRHRENSRMDVEYKWEDSIE